MQTLTFPGVNTDKHLIDETRRTVPDVLRVSILTRLGRYDDAIILAKATLSDYRLDHFRHQSNFIEENAQHKNNNDAYKVYTELGGITGLLSDHDTSPASTDELQMAFDSITAMINQLGEAASNGKHAFSLVDHFTYENDPKAREEDLVLTMNQAVTFANYDRFEKLFNKENPSQSEKYKLYVNRREAYYAITQICDMLNAFAYARAETSTNLLDAWQDSLIALGLIRYLMMRVKDKTTTIYRKLNLKVAPYYDTVGWIQYRLEMQKAEKDILRPEKPSNEDNLYGKFQYAEMCFRTALQQDGKKAIFHYHLARLYLSRVEILWQQHSDMDTGSQSIQPYIAFIDRNLTQAFREWQVAKNLDSYGRLHTRLRWLYNRVNNYKRSFDDRQLRGIVHRRDR